MSAFFFTPPTICTDAELNGFVGLVRTGFAGARHLDRRVREARCLGFFRVAPTALVAVAALKSPNAAYRRTIFARAAATVDSDDYAAELGWVFVLPRHRRAGIARQLCEGLLSRMPAAPVFATSRVDNTGMHRILRALEFTGVGEPFVRREETLRLFVRPGSVP